MVRNFLRKFRSRNLLAKDIDPDEIFLDSSNLPEFDRSQMEGRIEKPISSKAIFLVGILLVAVAASFISRLWYLQVVSGSENTNKAENNRLRQTQIFAERGIIYDRNNEALAWNEANPENSDFSLRKYATTTGLSHVLGYVKYPSKDSSGFYFRNEMVGVDGVEGYQNSVLSGQNGLKIVETNAVGSVQSESTINPPLHGQNITLSIDSGVQSELYTQIGKLANEVGFVGGAGVIMDVKTGEILAMTSYPEFNSQVMTDGDDAKTIASYNTNINHPFLDKVISGLYTPGSIVKPLMAIAALNEHIIDPNKIIEGTAYISIPNPYDESKPSIFRDWRAQGPIDMRKALAVSSDVYFYEVGGGFEDQKGLGITLIDKYMKMFGLGKPVGDGFFNDKVGVIPTPEWKEQNFDGDPWRLGDTYHTAIGQYGFQVTPIQMVRADAAIANNGELIEPTIIASTTGARELLPIEKKDFQIVREGMRQGVTTGIAQALNLPQVQVAAKTGTAELGVTKQQVNSWVTGFFPYNNPRYAFAIVMEKGSRDNLKGAVFVMNGLFNWMGENTPQYLK